MPVTSGSIRPRRTPRFGHSPRRPAVTVAQSVRRHAEYRRLRALIRTPQGAVRFMRHWAGIVTPEEVAAEVDRFNEWFACTQAPTVEEQARAEAFIRRVFYG